MITQNHEWRCQRCGRLLGIMRGNRLEIRFSRGHQYLASLPISCVCQNSRCNTLNELTAQSVAVAGRTERQENQAQL